MNPVSTISSSEYCKDDEFRIHLFGKTLRYFTQGVAAALLMPLEMLESLRSGDHPSRRLWFSWALSAVMYVSGFEIWTLSQRSFVDGHDRTGAIASCCLAMLLAGLFSGRLQAGNSLSEIRNIARRRRGWHHRHYHDHQLYHHLHGFQHHAGIEWNGDGDLDPQEQAATPGICCGNCQKCKESICAKTGAVKRRKSL